MFPFYYYNSVHSFYFIAVMMVLTICLLQVQVISFAASSTIINRCSQSKNIANHKQQILSGLQAPNTDSVVAEEFEAKQFITELNDRLEVLNTVQANFSWQFNTNINSQNEARLVGLIIRKK